MMKTGSYFCLIIELNNFTFNLSGQVQFSHSYKLVLWLDLSYQLALILAQFEGVNLTLTALKISYLEQINSKPFMP
ncbi:hypothetical protein EAG18_06190 [Pseudoalteromonas sp. J010]|uniref:Uncharacterized protein n=1 Tax=Pseudoalteromonas peptidolytica F12-50-A1 TaxID=1315280 RepID=A0A8I0MZM4_9GAMM|nr:MULTISPECIES: hypothetical protein [Pseudoalteromonas]MBE0348161.1 hypothetical protein [Pseudoalteromonas peptidolytica F12-50-A1]MDW7550912.1 hypothetical protein [Pseudoalteromonas peptidolytica]NLR15498.1 hypothetical protein [Pseudoalteromonas peptidolytica]RRS09534.1 hypothetical protein EAG18_06190 [Pseudoalteromonas sp. J010]